MSIFNPNILFLIYYSIPILPPHDLQRLLELFVQTMPSHSHRGEDDIFVFISGLLPHVNLATGWHSRQMSNIMDPLHITEFASPRYFDKLRSLNDTADNADKQTPPEDASTLPQAATTITLPLGNPRPPTGRRRRSDDNARPSDQKRRSLGHDLAFLRTQRRPRLIFAGLKSKIAARPKGLSSFLEHEYIFEGEEDQPIQEHHTLNELFFSLPNEIQLQIITPLPMPTILNLRLVSKSFHSLVSLNESSIARYHVACSVPAFVIRLYPLPDPSEINLHYLCGIWHRLYVAQKLAIFIAEDTTKQIFLRDTEAKWNEFLPQHTRMRRRLMPLIFTVFHFFEKYRELHVQHLVSCGIPLRRQAFTLNPIERQVMDMYEDELLLKVHQIFPLLLSSFSRRLRPPSYAGRLERSIKGMLKDKPADEVYTTILAVGGLRQAGRFWETKGYNTRRATVDQWYSFVIQEPAPPLPQRSKFSMLSSLGRKKVTPVTDGTNDFSFDITAVSHHDASRCKEWYCVKPTCINSWKHNPPGNLVYNTSLAAGPPMSPLPREQLRLILSDQQELTNIWLQTGEAVILERKIVENSMNIKRNTQVLLELIKEEGSAMDEDWAPGLAQVSRHALENFRDAETFDGV